MESLPPPPKNKFRLGLALLGILIAFMVKGFVDYVMNPSKHNYEPSYNTVTQTARQIKDDSDLYYFGLQLENIDKYSTLDSSINDSSQMFELKKQILSSTSERRAFLDSFYRAFNLFYIFYIKDYLECDISFSQGRKDSVCNWGDSTEKYYSEIYYQFKYTLITKYQKEYDGYIEYFRKNPKNVTLNKKEAEETKNLYLLKQTIAFSRNYEFLFDKKFH